MGTCMHDRGEDMRNAIAAPVMASMLVLAGLTACSSEPPPAPKEEEAPVVMSPGEWQMTRHTTGYNTPTVTPAEYQKALKQVVEEKVCITLDKDGAPAPDILAGDEGSACTFKDKMLRKGRLIATLSCTSGKGSAEIAVEGNYTADTLTLGTTMTKTEGGKPVLRTTRDLSGKRLGDCPAT